MRILVIEHEHVDLSALRQKVLTEITGENSATLIPAEDVPTALALLSRERFDHIVLDLRIDSSDGIEAYQKVAAKAPSTPITVWSGEPPPDHVSREIPVPIHVRDQVEDVVSVMEESIPAGDAELYRSLADILKTVVLIGERVQLLTERLQGAEALAREGRDNFLALKDEVVARGPELRGIQQAVTHHTEVLRELKEWSAVISIPVNKVQDHLAVEIQLREQARSDKVRWQEWRGEKADQVIEWLTTNRGLTTALTISGSLVAVGSALWILDQLGVPAAEIMQLIGWGSPAAPESGGT